MYFFLKLFWASQKAQYSFHLRQYPQLSQHLLNPLFAATPMALSSFVPALSSPPPHTAAILNHSGSPPPLPLYTATILNRSGSPPAPTSSSSPSCSVRFTCSISPTTRTFAFMRPTTLSSSSSRRSSQIVRMAPEEEKMTRRSPLDFPIVSLRKLHFLFKFYWSCAFLLAIMNMQLKFLLRVESISM